MGGTEGKEWGEERGTGGGGVRSPHLPEGPLISDSPECQVTDGTQQPPRRIATMDNYCETHHFQP